MHVRWPAHAAILMAVLVVTSCAAATPGSTGTQTEGEPPAASTQAGSADQSGDPAEPSEPTGDAEAPPIAACDLVDEEEVSDAIGSEVGAGNDVLGSCSWTSADDELYVSLVVAPLAQDACVDVHEALGASEVFEYEAGGDFASPAFWSYGETLAETHIGAWEICTEAYNVGVRVEGPEPDEAAHREAATRLAELVLPRVAESAGG
jgi:hypothetical protein